MACCGDRRAAAGAGAPTGAWIEFHYVGPTALTVVGPTTRYLYRFAAPGARVAVDPRDARSFDGVPNLRRVPSA
jgi:hypothetical protein